MEFKVHMLIDIENIQNKKGCWFTSQTNWILWDHQGRHFKDGLMWPGQAFYDCFIFSPYSCTMCIHGTIEKKEGTWFTNQGLSFFKHGFHPSVKHLEDKMVIPYKSTSKIDPNLEWVLH